LDGGDLMMSPEPSTPKTPLGLSVSAVQIDAKDWDSMVGFYQDVLGFRARYLEPHHRYGWLSAGAIDLAIRGGHAAGSSSPRISLLLEVADIVSTMATLTERGCHFHDVQLDTGEDYRIAYFRDPEGNTLAIFDYAEAPKA
jgi:predicted enzyme related to lactoylglutathione lyase